MKVETDDTQGGKSTGKASLNREVIEGEERMIINIPRPKGTGYVGSDRYGLYAGPIPLNRKRMPLLKPP
jgi:hypothetical protein